MNKKTIMLLAVGASLLAMSDANACSYFFLKAQDGSVVTGRSQEFYTDLESVIETVPRGIAFTSTVPEGGKAVSWKTKYGFVGISHYGRSLFSDGLNEAGLAAGLLWFGDTENPKVKPGESAVDVSEAVGWILGNFKTVAEVKEALQTVKISATFFPQLKMILPMHLYVTDASGHSIVIEHVGEEVVVSDNEANGVMTNEPELRWHLMNMRFYANMNPVTTPALNSTIPGMKDVDWALGTGLLGLPGDYTAASRFVRLSILKKFAAPVEDADKGVNLAVHLLNVVDIPFGPQLWIQGGKGFVQYTPWVVIYDQKNRYFYYRTYENPTLRRIDLNKLSLDKGTQLHRFKLYGGDGYVDDTARFLSDSK